jgi:GNAT superfamily N-acetyltransferase
MTDRPALPDIVIRPVGADERAGWQRLFEAYAAFYRVPLTQESVSATWRWLHDPAYPVEGVLALADGEPVGFAHFRGMPNPLRGREFGFLDDLYVDPSARGRGVGEALLGHLAAVARERGWPKLRWLTADDNYRARTLYDRVAAKTGWNLYELSP